MSPKGQNFFKEKARQEIPNRHEDLSLRASKGRTLYEQSVN